MKEFLMMKSTFLCISLFLFTAISCFAQSATVIKENANLRGTASERGKVVDVLPQNTVLEVLQQRGAWFLVQSNDYVGWVHGNTIRIASSTSGSDYTPVRTVTPRPSPAYVEIPRSSSRSYIRGPRGGCYYINSSGRKSYVDRSLCN